MYYGIIDVCLVQPSRALPPTPKRMRRPMPAKMQNAERRIDGDKDGRVRGPSLAFGHRPVRTTRLRPMDTPALSGDRLCLGAVAIAVAGGKGPVLIGLSQLIAPCMIIYIFLCLLWQIAA